MRATKVVYMAIAKTVNFYSRAPYLHLGREVSGPASLLVHILQSHAGLPMGVSGW